jgi:hypothetical protein
MGGDLMPTEFRAQLEALLSKHGYNNRVSNTATWIFADVVIKTLEAFKQGIRDRDSLMGKEEN